MAKEIVWAGCKIAGCLALNFVAPGLGSLAGLLLGGTQDAGGGGGPLEGMATNLLSGIINNVWIATANQRKSKGNYHLERALIRGIQASLDHLNLAESAKKSVRADLANLANDRERLRAFFSLDAGSYSHQRVGDEIVAGLGGSSAAVDRAWAAISSNLRREVFRERGWAASEAEQSRWKEAVLASLREEVAQFILTDPDARDKFAFYADQLQLEMAKHQGQLSQEILDEVRALSSMGSLVQTMSSEFKELKSLLAGRAAEIDGLIGALQRAGAVQGFLSQHQLSQVRADNRERRRMVSLCVGRDHQLTELITRLRKGGVHLVQAESGTGKSTFINALLEHPEVAEWRVAWHFFSSLGVLAQPRQALLHLLATLKESTGSQAIPDGPGLLLDDLGSCLKGAIEHEARTGKKVLIVLDALDEASLGYQDHFKWLRNLPDGAVVVCSVRASHQEKPTPLPFENYQKFELEQQISAEAVEEWMTLAGDGQLASRAAEKAEQVHRATEGHTLFLRFVLDDPERLVASGGDAALETELRALGAGFEGYVQAAYEQLSGSDREWLPVLAALAAAHDELDVVALRHLGSPDGEPGWSVKRWLRVGVAVTPEGDLPTRRFDHPRIKEGFRRVPNLAPLTKAAMTHLWEGCRDRASWLPSDYRLRFGVQHGLEVGRWDEEALAVSLDRLTDPRFLKARLEASNRLGEDQLTLLTREMAEAERLAKDWKEKTSDVY